MFHKCILDNLHTLSGLAVHLLHIQMYWCKGNHATEVRLNFV
jgi:hypothetical protein